MSDRASRAARRSQRAAAHAAPPASRRSAGAPSRGAGRRRNENGAVLPSSRSLGARSRLSRSRPRSIVVTEGQQALVVRLGAPVGVETEPGLKIKAPLIDSVFVYDTRLLLLEPPTEQVILGDQKRLEVQPYARYRIVDPLRFYQALRTIEQARAQLAPVRQLLGAPRTRPGDAARAADRPNARDDRRRDPRRGRRQGRAARHRDRRGAFPPRRPAVRDQPGDLRPHEIGAPARGQGIARARLRMGAADPVEGRPRAHRRAVGGAARATIAAARATPRRAGGSPTRIGKDPKFYEFYRSLQTYRHALADSGADAGAIARRQLSCDTMTAGPGCASRRRARRPNERAAASARAAF